MNVFAKHNNPNKSLFFKFSIFRSTNWTYFKKIFRYMHGDVFI